METPDTPEIFLAYYIEDIENMQFQRSHGLIYFSCDKYAIWQYFLLHSPWEEDTVHYHTQKQNYQIKKPS
jgi:hypothetical protein